MKAICYNDPSLVLTGIKDSLRSHKLVFAAERSRINGTIETIDIWKEIIQILPFLGRCKFINNTLYVSLELCWSKYVEI